MLPVTTERSAIIPNRQRMDYLDGIRGLAALVVLLFHLGQSANAVLQQYASPGAARLLHYSILFDLFVNGYGHQAVVVFIVLSGYCLMLPVVRKRGLDGGVRGFAQRRSRRILPPYYAALAFGILVPLFWPALRSLMDAMTGTSSPSISVGSVVSHMLLVQNWTPWLYGINPPLWSVAVEWQIYFVFALILLPAWQRLGMGAAVGIGIVLGLIPLYLIPHIGILAQAQPLLGLSYPWMLGAFAVGMAAADQTAVKDLKWNYGQITIVLSLAFLVLHLHDKIRPIRHLLDWPEWISDYIVAAVSGCVILQCAKWASGDNRSAVLLRIFESRIAMRLGAFSYSLYLTHVPVLAAVRAVVSHSPLVIALPLMIVGGLFTAVLLAYIFHLAFERPFMSKPAPKTERQAEVAAITNPAP
jgi:peptidoglycan/LPS O-acetylase OafA/YrhL